VFRFWECEIEKEPVHIATQIGKELRGDAQGSPHYQIPNRTILLKAAEARAGCSKKC
jgi:hypothetical protein